MGAHRWAEGGHLVEGRGHLAGGRGHFPPGNVKTSLASITTFWFTHKNKNHCQMQLTGSKYA